jgi:hypothetical protein
LGKFYPNGFGPTRFIIPLSILISIFLAVRISEIKLNKLHIILLIALSCIALIFNYNLLIVNYENHSYSSSNSRYGLLAYLDKNNLSFDDNLNYRFGTNHYIFSETINYKHPYLSQTRGYYDQSIYYPEEYWTMVDALWNIDNATNTLHYLDWYGIKYLELEIKESEKMHVYNSSKFKKLFNGTFYDYSFILYEYLEAKPLLSILNNSVQPPNLNSLDFNFTRPNPDYISLDYNFTGKEIILFKESYHSSWAAKGVKTSQKIKVEKSEHNFVILVPPKNEERVIIYQKKTSQDLLGLSLTIIGGIFALLYLFSKPLRIKPFKPLAL